MHPKALHTLTKSFVVFAVIALILSIVVPTLSVLNTQVVSKQSDSFAASKRFDSEQAFDGVVIRLTVIPPTRNSMNSLRFGYEILPFGNLANRTRFARPVQLTLGGSPVSANAGETIPKGAISIGISEGDMNLYPMDSYEVEFELTASSGNRSVPMGVLLGGQGGGFEYRPTFTTEDDTDPEQYYIIAKVTYARTILGRIFSFFAVVLMWAITLSILSHSSLLWFTPQLPPLFIPVVAVLFALPRLRDVQPGIGDIGNISDLYGFFPCMFIAFLNGILC
jgi:hypothetical protein